MNLLKRSWGWVDDRTGISGLLKPLADHLVPAGSGWAYVFGSATLFAFIVQVVTGIALATSYVSSTSGAYASLLFISNDAFLGRFLRGVHYFGASAMVLLVAIHMARVFLTGSYKFPREVNWLTGVILLLATLVMAFTGQLLRWDQDAVWSVVVGAQQAGRVPMIGTLLARFIIAGDNLGAATLSRFFAFHVFFFPAAIFAVLGAHLFLAVRNGVSEPPKIGKPVHPQTYREDYDQLLREEGVRFWPDAAWRDVVFSVFVIVVVAALAIVFGPPQLGKPPDPTLIEAYPRPDWYFLWYFALLALLPPGLESYVIVLGPTLLGIGLLLLPFIANRGERHPLRRPWAIAIVLATLLMIGVMWMLGEQAAWSPDFNAQPLRAQEIGSNDATIVAGAQLFHDAGCQYCHAIDGNGGQRGPDLTAVGDRLSSEQLVVRVLNGGTNMPAFASSLTPEQLNAIVAFLQSRSASGPGSASGGAPPLLVSQD